MAWIYLTTESGDTLITESSNPLVTEESTPPVDVSWTASVGITFATFANIVPIVLPDSNEVAYEVWLALPSGTRVRNIPGRLVISLSYSRVVNAISELNLVIPYGLVDSVLIQPDGIIEIWRKIGGGPLYLETDTIWFIRRIVEGRDESGLRTIIITCWSANCLAAHRLVAYAESQTLGYSTKYDEAGDMLIAVARENLGDLVVDTTRDVDITVQSAASIGPTIYKQFPWRSLDEVFRDICETSFQAGTPLYWDITSLEPPLGLRFEVRTGQRGRDLRLSANERTALLVSPRLRSVTSYTVTYDYTEEVNVVYVSGPGADQDKIVIPYEDTARSERGPYSRKEGLVDARDGNISTMADDGKVGLRQGTPRVLYEGRLASVPGAIYGRDWKWGDYITAQDDDQFMYEVRINAIAVSVSNNREERIEATLRSDE